MWWSLHPWRHSNAACTWSWATYSRWPCFSRDVGPDGAPEVPFNLNCCVILWTVPCYLISHCKWASRRRLTLFLDTLFHGSSVVRLSNFQHYLLSDFLSDYSIHLHHQFRRQKKRQGYVQKNKGNWKWVLEKIKQKQKVSLSLCVWLTDFFLLTDDPDVRGTHWTIQDAASWRK